MSDYKRELQDALEQAKKRLPMPDLVARIGIQAPPKKSVTCPFCHGKGKFSVYPVKTGWGYKCFKDTCDASKPGDEIDLLALKGHGDRNQAIDEYLALAGVANPRDKFREREEHARKAAVKRIEETPREMESWLSIPQDDKKRNPYEWVWARLILTSKHREDLQRKRGFDDALISAAGFKSSRAENRELLEGLIDAFPSDELLKTGLCQREERGHLKLSAQLRGYGQTGEFDSEGEPIFDWKADPILIPYPDEHGRLLFLRPHKGGFSARDWLDEHPGQIQQMAHVYCPPPPPTEEGQRPDMTLILTEGEFKAAALRCAHLWAWALPGINIVKPSRRTKDGPNIRDELLRRLRYWRPRTLNIVYDNEDRSTPDTPRYQPDPEKRHEADVWAHWLAQDLAAEGPKGLVIRVGRLPDEWRSGGKADWDGALAQFIAENPANYRLSLSRARRRFDDCLAKAKASPGLNDMRKLGEERWRVVARRLEQLNYQCELEEGGEYERELIAMLDPHDFPWEWWGKLQCESLKAKLKKTLGGYYTRASRGDAQADKLNAYLKLLHRQEKELEQGRFDVDDNGWPVLADHPPKDEDCADLDKVDPDKVVITRRRLAKVRAIIDYLADGKPVRCSNFTVSCRYRVCFDETEDGQGGTIQRLVQFHGRSGVKSALLTIPADVLSQPHDFKTFVLKVPPGDFNWLGGADALGHLVEYMNSDSFGRVVKQIRALGYLPRADMHLSPDSAFTKEALIFPDEDGMIWHNDDGYQLNTAIDFPVGLNGYFPNGPCEIDRAEERRENTTAFHRLKEDFFLSLGDYGYLLLGHLFAYLGAQDFIALEKSFPGINLIGEAGSGKSTIIRWAMMLYGFARNFRIPELNSTTYGVATMLSQHSEIPLPLDEYQESNPRRREIDDAISSCFNRNIRRRGKRDSSDGTEGRAPQTSPIVGGQSFSSEERAISRFFSVPMSPAARRIGPFAQARLAYRVDHDDSPHFYRLVRFCLLKWGRFRELLMRNYAEYSRDPQTMAALPSARDRQVFGVGYCAFKTLLHPEFFGLADDEEARALLDPATLSLLDPNLTPLPIFADISDAELARILEAGEKTQVPRLVPRPLFVDEDVSKKLLPRLLELALQTKSHNAPLGDINRFFNLLINAIERGLVPKNCLQLVALRDIYTCDAQMEHLDYTDDSTPSMIALYFEGAFDLVKKHAKECDQPLFQGPTQLRRMVEQQTYWIKPKRTGNIEVGLPDLGGFKIMRPRCWVLEIAKLPSALRGIFARILPMVD